MQEQLITYVKMYGYFNLNRLQKTLANKGFKRPEVWLNEGTKTLDDGVLIFDLGMLKEITDLGRAEYERFIGLIKMCNKGSESFDTSLQDSLMKKLNITEFSRNDKGHIEWFIYLDIKFVYVRL